MAAELAAGNTNAAARLGRYLDRRAYGEACVQAARLQRLPMEQAIARYLARWFVALREGALGLWPRRGARMKHKTSVRKEKLNRRPRRATVKGRRDEADKEKRS